MTRSACQNTWERTFNLPAVVRAATTCHDLLGSIDASRWFLDHHFPKSPSQDVAQLCKVIKTDRVQDRHISSQYNDLFLEVCRLRLMKRQLNLERQEIIFHQVLLAKPQEYYPLTTPCKYMPSSTVTRKLPLLSSRPVVRCV